MSISEKQPKGKKKSLVQETFEDISQILRDRKLGREDRVRIVSELIRHMPEKDLTKQQSTDIRALISEVTGVDTNWQSDQSNHLPRQTQMVVDLFLREKLDRNNRETIVLELVRDMEEFKDLDYGQSRDIRASIEDTMRRPEIVVYDGSTVSSQPTVVHTGSE